MNKNERSIPACHISPPEGLNLNKTIVIFHGWGSSVKNYEEFAKSLSVHGFRVILPELPFHDSRGKLENHFNKEITQEYFWKAIFSSIEESDYLWNELRIHPKDIILLGISMGGFIASGIHAKFREFAGLININGSGSFLLSEKIFREQDARPALPVEEIDRFSSYDPRQKNRGNSPVLMMHGKQDSIVSIKGQEDYYAYLSNGSLAEDLTFLKYENINHTISEEMKDDLLHWLKEKFE